MKYVYLKINKLYCKLYANAETEIFIKNKKLKSKKMYNLPTITNELNKTQIKIIATDSINDIIDSGRILDVAEFMSKAELFFKEIKSNEEFIQGLRDEVSKHGKVFLSNTGTKIELAETGTDYFYENCNDWKYELLKSKMIELKKEISDRETFLKALPISGEDFLTPEGEVVKIFPPYKVSKSSTKTTIAK